MESLRRVGWGLLANPYKNGDEEEALNLALALSLSEESIRPRPNTTITTTTTPSPSSSLSSSSSSLESLPEIVALPEQLRISLEDDLDDDQAEEHDPITCSVVEEEEDDNLPSPRTRSALDEGFDERMKRIASAFDLRASLRSAFSPRVVNDDDNDHASADSVTTDYTNLMQDKQDINNKQLNDLHNNQNNNNHQHNNNHNNNNNNNMKVDERTLALRRLQQRLREYTLVEYEIRGDGNCQFGSLSDQLYRTPRLHNAVRRAVVQQLTDYPEHYARFVAGDYGFYCWRMGRNHVWGDHLTLQAAADCYGIQIALVTSYGDASHVHIMPREIRSSRILWLSFFGEFHYNSLYTEQDIELRRRMDEGRAEANACVLC